MWTEVSASYSAHAVSCDCSGHGDVIVGRYFSDKRFTDLKLTVRELGDDTSIAFIFLCILIFFSWLVLGFIKG